MLELIALTLRQGPENAEVYAAVKNRGDTPACDAAFAIELFDHQEQSLAAGISGLLAPHFYRRTNGSETIVGCVGPGDISMAAIADLPSELAVEAVGFIVYRVGRPLGMLSARSHSVDVPPGGSWAFETGQADYPASGWVAFAEAALSR